MDPPSQALQLLALTGRQRHLRTRWRIAALALLLGPATQQLRAHADLLGHVRDRPIRIQHQSRSDGVCPGLETVQVFASQLWGDFDRLGELIVLLSRPSASTTS